MSAASASKEFFDLVKAIGESKSKQEEDRIMLDEVQVLKRKMMDVSTTKKKMKELLVRLIYVEMLGHDGSFGYIKAVELCASTNLLQKRVGYLTASLVLSPDHELRMMLVNQLQRDMNSMNHMECWAALTSLCKLVTADMIPAVSGDVVKLMGHKIELVRKKAVMALHRFHQLEPSTVEHLLDHVRVALCDRDPSVMAAALCVLQDMIVRNPGKFKDLVPSFVSILKQIIETKLPRDYDYHRMPAPWIQMRLLQMMSVLGHGDQASSEGMYEILLDVMKRSDIGTNIGYAIMYECIRTVTWIYPNKTLLDTAASSIARFIASENHNLKYLGITGLAELVKDHPKYAADHQLAVIECLEDHDDTLRRKTLDLLYRMINPVNVEFIVDKLLSVLEASTDEYLRNDLVGRITRAAERYAPDNGWYIRTMTRVFELAGDLVQGDVAQNLMTLIAEGSGDDDDLDHQLRCESVEHLCELLCHETEGEAVGSCTVELLHIIAWVLGEYGTLVAETEMAEECPVNVVMDKLCSIAERASLSTGTRAHVISALLKLSAQTGTCSPRISILVDTFSRSSDLDVQQRSQEFVRILQFGASMKAVLPLDASCEDLEEDGELQFLETYVAQALSNGAAAYNPPTQDDDEEDEEEAPKDTGLKYDAYAAPENPMRHPAAPFASSSSSSSGSSQPDGTGGPPTPGVPQPQGGSSHLRSKANAIGSGNFGGSIAGPWGTPQPGPSQQPPQPSQQQDQDPGHTNGHVESMTDANEYASPGSETHPPEDEGPRELTEKERQAALLFGGISGSGGGGAGSGVRSGRSSGRRSAKAQKERTPPPPPQKQQQQHAPTSEPVSTVTTKPPEPEPMIDLLDMEDVAAPPPAVATSTNLPPVAHGLDLLATTTPPPATPMQSESSVPKPVVTDPFAAAGLVQPISAMALGGQEDTFSYNGAALKPLVINTQQFGGKWVGLAKSEKKAQVQTTKVGSPDAFGELAKRQANVHLIQTIASTMECIMAGETVNGVATCVHVKVVPGRQTVVVTVRSGDYGLSAALCDFFVGQLR